MLNRVYNTVLIYREKVLNSFIELKWGANFLKREIIKTCCIKSPVIFKVLKALYFVKMLSCCLKRHCICKASEVDLFLKSNKNKR